MLALDKRAKKRNFELLKNYTFDKNNKKKRGVEFGRMECEANNEAGAYRIVQEIIIWHGWMDE